MINEMVYFHQEKRTVFSLCRNRWAIQTYNEAKVFAIRASHRHGEKVWIYLFELVGWDPKGNGRKLPIHLPRKRK